MYPNSNLGGEDNEEKMTTKEMQQEALSRAQNGRPNANYLTILQEFGKRGIDIKDVRPRENVFTYQAWLALGRQVRRGERGVCVETFVPMTKINKDTGEEERFSVPRSTTVFHESQTDVIE